MLETQIQQLSVDELDKMFDSSDLPTADNLVVGKQEDGTDIPILDDDSKIVSAEEAIEEDKKVEEENKSKEEEKEEKEDKETEDSKEEEENIDLESINSVLKNTVDYLIDNDLWADFDGREGLEITQEVYADIASKQAQHQAYQMFNELVDGTGDYGKAIFSHIKQGGNPDEIIDIFKEQKELENIDTTTEDGKQLKIEQYYKDVLGWKPERVKKFINRLVEDNDIATEFENVEDSYKEYYKEKLQETQRRTAEQEQIRKDNQNRFVNSIKSALEKKTDLSEKDKRFISSSILDFRHKLNNGQKVNDFYLKFAEMQSDPEEYIELVQFVTDREAYKERIRKIEKSNAAKEQFNFIKGNASIGKAKSSNIEPQQNKDRTEKYKGTNFSFAIKK